ncbi:MAG: hypothetical protein IJZ44_03745 [Lachnospiraceae bacterium]|nr:hypothetical protein [Lachnospiraceae bacterium]MBQ8232314.1 hypothetical protein [Lachnospiraceae bacterium]
MKRILTLLLTVVMAVTSVPVTSYATESESKVYVDVRNNGTDGFTLGADYTLEGSVITAAKTDANPNIIGFLSLRQMLLMIAM